LTSPFSQATRSMVMKLSMSATERSLRLKIETKVVGNGKNEQGQPAGHASPNPIDGAESGEPGAGNTFLKENE
jgi:hypothetical protein